MDVLRRPERAVGTRDVDASVEIGDDGRQRVDVRGSELTAREHAARERVLRELAHLDRVLERRPAATDRRSSDAAGNWDNVEIKRRREPAIEPQFLLAVETPRGERREIEEPQCNRLLDLVRVAPRQEHVGNVRLEALDSARNRCRTPKDRTAPR